VLEIAPTEEIFLSVAHRGDKVRAEAGC